MHWDIPEECKCPERGTKVIHRYLSDAVEKVDWRKAKKLQKKFQCLVIGDEWLV